MPRKGPTGMEAMYQSWKDASPVMPFPFQFRKGGTTITHSWKDVRDGLVRDSTSGAIHKSLAHITPSVVQSELIKDEILREEKFASPRHAHGPASLTPRGTGDTKLPAISSAPPHEPGSARTPRQIEAIERVKDVGRTEYLKQARQAPYTNDATVAGYWPCSKAYGGTLSARRTKNDATAEIVYHRKSHNRDVYRVTGVFSNTE